jgi:hypothetical protein
LFARTQVRLVRELATGHIFAMKKLKKSEMVRRGQARALGALGARAGGSAITHGVTVR